MVYGGFIALGFLGMSFASATADWCDEAKWMVFVGYVFFLISDSLLSIDYWVRPTRLGQWLVMFTYYVAQFLLATGLVVGETDKPLLW